jgi:hypothetical protein
VWIDPSKPLEKEKKRLFGSPCRICSHGWRPQTAQFRNPSLSSSSGTISPPPRTYVRACLHRHFPSVSSGTWCREANVFPEAVGSSGCRPPVLARPRRCESSDTSDQNCEELWIGDADFESRMTRMHARTHARIAEVRSERTSSGKYPWSKGPPRHAANESLRARARIGTKA